MRERNLFYELIQGIEEMRAQREAMFMKGRNALEDMRTVDRETQELEVHALSTEQAFKLQLKKKLR